jgi:hypothetical protein
MPHIETEEPDRAQCLECAFTKLLISGGVQTAENEQAADVIGKAQNISTSILRTRATIYRCGALGCEYAIMTITDINQSVLPEDPKDIQVKPVPGSLDCILPSAE